MKIKLKLLSRQTTGKLFEVELQSPNFDVADDLDTAEICNTLWNMETRINADGAVRAHVSLEEPDGTTADSQQASSGRT